MRCARRVPGCQSQAATEKGLLGVSLPCVIIWWMTVPNCQRAADIIPKGDGISTALERFRLSFIRRFGGDVEPCVGACELLTHR